MKNSISAMAMALRLRAQGCIKPVQSDQLARSHSSARLDTNSTAMRFHHVAMRKMPQLMREHGFDLGRGEPLYQRVEQDDALGRRPKPVK